MIRYDLAGRTALVTGAASGIGLALVTQLARNGARVALWVVPNIEHYEYLPKFVRTRDPWPRSPHPDVLGYSLRDYGNRVGLWRLFQVTDDLGIPCTVSLSMAVLQHFPEPTLR